MRQALISKWVIAIVLTIPILLLIPSTAFKKYSLKETSSIAKTLDGSLANYFADLNGNNKNERILSVHYKTHLSFLYFDHQNSMYGQHNFYGNYEPKLDQLYFFDVNNNGKKEIYGFTLQADSLFLNWFEPFSDTTSNKEACFISKVNTYGNNKFDVQLPAVKCIDFDNDGDNEIVFVLHNGFSKFPRQIFILNPETKEIQCSLNQGATLNSLQFSDIDNDNKKEMFCLTRATNNLDETDTTTIKDDCTWLIAYDDDLNYLFNPVRIQKGIGSRFTPYVFSGSDSGNYIIGLAQSVAPHNNYCTVLKFNCSGQLLDSLAINTKERRYPTFSVKENEYSILVQLVKDKIHRVASDLKRVEEIPLLEGKDLLCYQSCDVNLDGEPEYLFSETGLNNMYLFSDNFRHFNKIILDEPILKYIDNYNYSKNTFVVETKTKSHFYVYSRNYWYEIKYVMWLMVYLVVVLIVYVIQKLQENRIKERYELQNQVRELQFKTFRNQLDPHFIFNTFNSVASVIKQGRTDDAYKLFMGFSKMLRSSLSHTENILIPIDEELVIVQNYLNIQKFRFNSLFNYSITVDETVDRQFLIPKMLIQIHTENALKHGFRPKKSGGELIISITKAKQKIEITITDNGIGRAESKQRQTHGTGLGLKTLEHFIQHVNREKKMSIKQSFVDLYDEKGDACGTKVIITILKK